MLRLTQPIATADAPAHLIDMLALCTSFDLVKSTDIHSSLPACFAPSHRGHGDTILANPPHSAPHAATPFLPLAFDELDDDDIFIDIGDDEDDEKAGELGDEDLDNVEFEEDDSEDEDEDDEDLDEEDDDDEEDDSDGEDEDDDDDDEEDDDEEELDDLEDLEDEFDNDLIFDGDEDDEEDAYLDYFDDDDEELEDDEDDFSYGSRWG